MNTLKLAIACKTETTQGLMLLRSAQSSFRVTVLARIIYPLPQ